MRHINEPPQKKAKRLFIKKYKLDRGCSVCGYNKSPYALDFDHVDRNKKNFIMSNGHKYSWEKIINELENCIVLCSNCHREKTERNEEYFSMMQTSEENTSNESETH